MQLIVHGDSWAQGSELIDPLLRSRYPNLSSSQIEKNLYRLNNPYQRDNSFGGLIAKKLGTTQFDNLAHAGASNDSIVREVIRSVTEQIQKKSGEKLFVLIQWTWPSRTDLYFDEPVFWLPHHRLSEDGPAYWQTLCLYDSVKNTSYDKVRSLYYKHCYHSHEYISRFIHQVLFLQSFFKEHGISYLFFSGNNDPLWPVKLEKRGEYEPYLKYLMQMIDEHHYVDFAKPFNSLFTFLTEKKCCDHTAYEELDPELFGPEEHPTEKGHRLIAEKLWNYITFHKSLRNDEYQESYSGGEKAFSPKS